MNVCVMSPVHGQAGITSAAIFVSAAIALTQKRNVCLTHLDFMNMSIDKQFTLPPTTDLVKSLSQVVKLLKNNSINDNDIPYYTQEIMTNLYYYTSPSVNLSEEEFNESYKYLVSHFKFFSDIVIDMDANCKSSLYDIAISFANVIVIAVNHNKNVLDKAKELKKKIESRGAGKRVTVEAEKQIYFLLNHYNSKIQPYSKVASYLGVPPKQLLSLTDSYWIQSCANKGVTEDIYIHALSHDVKVNFLLNDIKRACKILRGKDFIWKE